MKKKLVYRRYVSAVLIFILLLPGNAFSATLFLKNGREIHAQRISDIGEKYRCHVQSGVILDIAKDDVDHVDTGEIQRKELRKSVSISPFSYDMWISGIDIYKVFQIAKQHDLPLTRKGYLATAKHYNPKFTEPYAKKCQVFSYASNLLGRPCFVYLYFTPLSMLLYKIQISWTVPHKTNIFRSELEAVLKDKYGPHPSFGFGIMNKTRTWKQNKNVKIVLEYQIYVTVLNYIDIQMLTIKEKEKQKIYNQKKQIYIQKDKQKF